MSIEMQILWTGLALVGAGLVGSLFGQLSWGLFSWLGREYRALKFMLQHPVLYKLLYGTNVKNRAELEKKVTESFHAAILLVQGKHVENRLALERKITNFFDALLVLSLAPVIEDSRPLEELVKDVPEDISDYALENITRLYGQKSGKTVRRTTKDTIH